MVSLTWLLVARCDYSKSVRLLTNPRQRVELGAACGVNIYTQVEQLCFSYCRVHRPQPFFLIKGLMVSEMWHRPVRSFLQPPTWIIRSSKVFMRAGGCALCMGCVGVMWHGKIQDMRKLNWDWLLTGRVPCVSPLSVDIREPFIVYEAGCGIWMLMLLGRR